MNKSTLSGKRLLQVIGMSCTFAAGLILLAGSIISRNAWNETNWPEGSFLACSKDGCTAVLLVAKDFNAGCLSELIRSDLNVKKVTTYLVFDHAPGSDDPFCGSDSWRLSKTMECGRIYVDRTQLIRKQFRCEQGSRLLLFNSDGLLIYRSPITDKTCCHINTAGYRSSRQSH